MASAAMQQHHQSLDSGHQSSGGSAAPNRHHLPAIRSGTSTYHSHTSQGNQYTSATYPEQSSPRIVSGAVNQTAQMGNNQNQHNHHQQIHHLNHHHHQEPELHQTRVTNDQAHFYYNQANQPTQEAHHHQHDHQHYHYSTFHTTDSGYASSATPYTNHHYEINNSNLDHYTSNPHYPFIQSFTNRTHDNNNHHHQHQSYAAASYMNETIEQQSSHRHHNYQSSSLETNQGRSIDNNHRDTTTKIERSENSLRHTNKGHEDLNSETVLTELGPKTFGVAAANNQTLTTRDTLSSEKRSPEKIEEISNSKKKKKQAANKTSNFSAVKDEGYNTQQLETTQQYGGDLHRHHSSTTYLDQQRPLTIKTHREVEYRWREGDHSEEHEQTTRIDRSSAGGGGGGSSNLSAFCQTRTNSGTITSADDSNEFTKHQAIYPLPVDSSVVADSSNHLLARYSSSSYQTLVNEEEQIRVSPGKQSSNNGNSDYNQLRILEMRKEKSRDAARSRRSKENHEFYELAKLLPLPAAITSQLDFLDKASIIRLTISFLKLRQFSVNGHPPWAPDFTTLGSINPYSSQSLSNYAEHYSSSSNNQDDPQQQSRPTSVAFTATSIDPYHQSTGCHQVDGAANSLIVSEKNNNLSKNNNTSSLFDIHQGTHILQSLDGFAFAIGRDGRFLYISETVSMYLGLSQVEMTGSSVFDYTHQQDHEELAKQLGIPYTTANSCNRINHQDTPTISNNLGESPPPASVHSQYSAASNETLIDDYVNSTCPRKRTKTQQQQQQPAAPNAAARGAYGGRNGKKAGSSKQSIKIEASSSGEIIETGTAGAGQMGDDHDLGGQTSVRSATRDCNGRIDPQQGTNEDPLVRQFCIRMKSTLTKRGCQHFKSSGYRVVHVVAHLRSYQSNDHGHLMDPLDEAGVLSGGLLKQSKRRGPKSSSKETTTNASVKEASKGSNDNTISDTTNLGADRVVKQKIIGMVAVAIALPPPSINELRLESDTFVLRLGLDLRVTHIEPKITELLNYPVELIAGRSLYSLIHPADVYQVQKCHRDLLRKGQMMSGYYRLLSRSGGYIWIQTCATLICNNTLGSQASILPISPMPTPNNNNSATTSSVHLTHGDHLHKLPNYLAPPPNSASSDTNTTTQYSISGANQHSKMASPGLSSHLSSNYDQLDQDQCVIFVNYMITNIVESNEILDICQSPNYTPLGSFSGSTNINSSGGSSSSNSITNNNNNVLFNSPASSCSSPCVNNSINIISSPRRQHGESKPREMKVFNGRRTTTNNSKAKPQIYLNNSGDENGHGTGQTNFNNMSEQVKIDPNSHFGESVTTSDRPSSTSVYSYSQTPGSVNLALNKMHANHDATWLGHTAIAPTASVTYGTGQAADHYSSMNRSIYKAAFGLDTNYSHHQQTPSVYQTSATAYHPASSVTNTWDSAAVAAVANLSTTNPYPHHHHQTTNHHHTSAGTYYNYYGYYGNKFI